MSTKTRSIVFMAMFVALSVVGASIKVPSPTGTVALDALPAFLGAMVFGPGFGALSAALGHLFSSLFAGFPMSFPLHLLVAVQMAVTAYCIGYVKSFNLIWATVLGIFLNGVLAPACFILLPQFGWAFFTGMLLPLLVGSTVNVGGATLIYQVLPKRPYNIAGGQ